MDTSPPPPLMHIRHFKPFSLGALTQQQLTGAQLQTMTSSLSCWKSGEKNVKRDIPHKGLIAAWACPRLGGGALKLSDPQLP